MNRIFFLKKIPGLTFFLLALISFSSCQKYFLDAKPKESIDDQSAIVNATTAESALLGVYDKLQSSTYYGGDGFQAAIYLSGGDHLWVGTLNYYNTFISHTYRADNTLLNNAWYAIYRVVNGSNHIIEKVAQLDSKTITADKKNQLTGEAYFLRALAFFDLARTWGNVPIVFKPTSSPNDFDGVKQSTQQQVYDQVLKDLTTAEPLLPETLNRNRITRKTLYAFRARVHLYRNEWEKAEEYATKVISDNNYELIDWTTFIKNKNTKESILELAFSTADQSAHFGSWSSDLSRSQFCPSGQLYKLLQNSLIGGDRKQLIKDVSTPTIQNFYVQLLYWRPEGDNPTYVFRLAEQYLIRAEARAKKENGSLQSALDDLNAVRKRAKLSNTTSTEKAAVIQAIEDERRVEFALEPHRWFDLVRTKKAGEVLGVTDDNKWIFPIPFNDISADRDLVQNSGY